MPGAVLRDRGAVHVVGAGAGAFLQNLLTNDIVGLKQDEGRYAALLTPQGKIVADMLVTPALTQIGGGHWLDLPRPLVRDVVAALNRYKLRAQVVIEDMSDSVAIVALWETDKPKVVGEIFRDPRQSDLGWRVICVASEAEDIASRFGHAGMEAYDHWRVAHGVPRGGVDFVYGDAFPHEASMDRFHGVDFHKGCYVGQEIVSRVEHRGTARKRVVPVVIDGARPEAGVAVTAGETEIGVMGSSISGRGLALLRLDKAQEALDAGKTLAAGGVPIRLA
jgi:folate-binding protein YgfZ